MLGDLVREHTGEEDPQGSDPEVPERLVQRLAQLISVRLGVPPLEAPPSYSVDSE